MNVSLYQAAAAMNAEERWQELITENLAAGASPGFRKQNVSFEDVAAASPLQLTNPSSPNFFIPVAVASTSFQQGEMKPTNGNLDFAIQGPGFFTVQLPNGQHAYTRDGEFQLNAQNELVTKENYPVLGSGGAVQFDPSNSSPITISPSGQISQGDQVKGQLQVVNFAKPGQLVATDFGYLLNNDPNVKPLPMPPDTAVRQGFLEGANTSPSMEMGGLINTMRVFEANQKVLQMQNDRMGQVITQLGGTS